MRAAICISGHLRKYKETYDNFVNFFLNPIKEKYEVDIFIHTWDTLNHAECSSAYHRTSVPMGDTNYNDVYNLYKPSKLIIENFENLYSNFLFKNFISNRSLEWSWPDSRTFTGEMLFSTPMFYKIFKCNELKKEKEIKENFTYDLTIRIRSDLVFNELFKINQINSVYLYTIGYDGDMFLDSLFMSNSKIMDDVCNCFNNLSYIYNNYNFDFGPEKTLGRHINNKYKIKLFADTWESIQIYR